MLVTINSSLSQKVSARTIINGGKTDVTACVLMLYIYDMSCDCVLARKVHVSVIKAIGLVCVSYNTEFLQSLFHFCYRSY